MDNRRKPTGFSERWRNCSWRTGGSSRSRNTHYGGDKSGTCWRSSDNDNDGEAFWNGKHPKNDMPSLEAQAKEAKKLFQKMKPQIMELQKLLGTRILLGSEDSDGNVKVIFTSNAEGDQRNEELERKLTNKISSLESSFFNSMDLSAEEGEKRQKTLIDWDEVNRQSDECEKARLAKLPPVKKEFYFEHPDVANMNDEYVENLRKSLNNITVSYAYGGTDKIPNPVETFDQAFSEYPEIMQEIRKHGFQKPFPIQCQGWPILLSGKDMIGIAQTGTGKTLTFLLPALIHIDGQDSPLSERGGANVLILAPTRELALQIHKEVEKYSYRNIKSICVYGGSNIRQQIKEAEQGAQIIIATPGRLNDFIMRGIVNTESITYLVLDEADRMLDMGFEPQIRKVLLSIRPDRQTVMTSATWPYLVQELARKYMINPIEVVVGSLNLAAVHSVTQKILIVKQNEKMNYLLEHIKALGEDDKIIVFVDKKTLADDLASNLILQKIDCQSIHGNRDQTDREQAIEDLKTGYVKILIATDVASRGIDITDITKVLNYDFPTNIEEYVHRVGRTGRAGKNGEAITFFTRRDWEHARELISILEEAEQEVPDELYKMRDGFEANKEKPQVRIRERRKKIRP